MKCARRNGGAWKLLVDAEKLESRRVDVAGITAHPDEPWMEQIARNVTMDGWGILCGCRYLLHDRVTRSILLLSEQ
jgi:hypothetical protein